MLYEILAGERPFKIDNPSGAPLREWATQHCQQPIATLPLEYRRYQRIINKALAKRIEKRYQSMEEIVMDLERL
jgi:serine/threonine-protein kinase